MCVGGRSTSDVAATSGPPPTALVAAALLAAPLVAELPLLYTDCDLFMYMV